VASFVEILQVECVVPNLVNRGAVKAFLVFMAAVSELVCWAAEYEGPYRSPRFATKERKL